MLELQRGVGQPAEGDRQPEVDGPVGQHGREGLAVGQAEAGQHGDQHELDHPESPRGDGDGGQDVGQPVGRQQVDGGDDVAERRHEDPQRGGVEEPVGRRPHRGPDEQRLVLHQHGEPAGQAFEQRREAVGVHVADVRRHPVDQAAGPLLAPGQQVEDDAEGAEEDHPDRGGHHDQDGRRRRPVPVGPRDPEAVGHEEADEGAPEDPVQHHGRADPLGAEGEAGVGTGDARLGQQAVPEGRSRRRATRGHVAERQGRQVDPEQSEAVRSAVGEHGVGELGVGHQRGRLEQDTECQIGHVDVGQGPDLVAVAGHEWDGHVEEEEEDEDRADAEADVPAHERTAVPPSAAPGRTRRLSPRHRCRVGLHRPHVDTVRPCGPAMLRTWPCRASSPGTTP